MLKEKHFQQIANIKLLYLIIKKVFIFFWNIYYPLGPLSVVFCFLKILCTYFHMCKQSHRSQRNYYTYVIQPVLFPHIKIFLVSLEVVFTFKSILSVSALQLEIEKIQDVIFKICCTCAILNILIYFSISDSNFIIKLSL